MKDIPGLTLVDYVDYSDGCYQFDYRAVWQDSEGRLYTGRDSGCSCPLPFEDYHSVKDLDRLTSFEELEKEYRQNPKYLTPTEWQVFKENVLDAFKALRKK